MPKEFGNFGLKNEQTKKDTISLDENKSKRSTGGAGKSGLESDTQTKFPIPVLLTCPHGGIAKLSPKRDSSNFPASCHFSEDSDLLTIHITESIALNIFSLFEKEVYRKIALIHRRFVDFNRDAKCAFENSNDKRAEYIYNEYHDGILETIKKMHETNTNGSRFLFDIHGTQESDADIYFGTDAKNCEGSTICGLLGLNPNALWDDTGLIKLLKDRGYKTCPNEPGDDELSKLDGGTTVRNYGGCNVSQRVEAIQCEIAPKFRNEHGLPQIEKLARDMAECIFKFVSRYISET
jgi:N-formylglutamate amidohydrolase